MHNFVPIEYKWFAVALINLQRWRHSGIFVCSWLAEVVSSCSPIFKSCILVSFKVVTFNTCKDRTPYTIKQKIGLLVTCTQRDLTATHSLMLMVFIWQQGAVTWHRVVWSVHAMFWGLSQQDKYCRMRLSNVCLTFQWTWQWVRGEDCRPQSLIVRKLLGLMLSSRTISDFWGEITEISPTLSFLSRIQKKTATKILFSLAETKQTFTKFLQIFETRHVDIQYILSLSTYTQ